ncbi:MAG TPA: hypothetical protein VGX91_14570 [Candidatus Cybelea sp.]|jgi:hypothetical protein|nr:hypothetical protein [Candidatus Cybelea sp.]
MGYVVVAYRPKPGCEVELLALTREHHGILAGEGLVTDRSPIIAGAKDGTIVEIFEWQPDGVERAHTNPAVLDLWKRYGAVCDYVSLATLPESSELFAGFEALN